ncbi:nitrogenase component 1 [Wukongibacter sp. M2B1]|uniref:nitrogenase component 1 n=1 Tax=Wukongibacter sp. M2B1 TaxID=3088895 RepID=UPI003D7AAECF
MRIASVIVDDIEGLSSLLVGMEECTTHSRLFNPKPEGEHGELHWLYVLDDHEVVFGCREGLIDALRKMDRAGAKAILLIVTCVPELIGEDIEGIIHEVQSELTARITFVMLGQFKNISYPPGSRKTIEALATLMEEKETDSSCIINVLGHSPEEDHIPTPFLLSELERHGFVLRYLAPGASLKDFQSGPDAVLNLVVSPYTHPLAVKMEKEFGVPYIALHNLYDVEDIERAYDDIAKCLDFYWDNEFEEERKEALTLQLQAQEKLRGLRYVLSLRIDVPIPLAEYLIRLGMEPLLLHLEEYYPEDKDYIQKIMSKGYNPLICRMVNQEADLSVLEKLSPDLCFGYLSYTNKTISCVPDMFDFYGQVGYNRTINLLRRVLNVLNEMNTSKKGDIKYGSTSF